MPKPEAELETSKTQTKVMVIDLTNDYCEMRRLADMYTPGQQLRTIWLLVMGASIMWVLVIFWLLWVNFQPLWNYAEFIWKLLDFTRATLW